jgi:hypothetical protein
MGSVGLGLQQQQQLLPSAPLVGETMGDNTSSLGEALDPTSFSQQQLCTRRSGQVNKSPIPFFLPPPTTKPTCPCRTSFLIISLQPIFFPEASLWFLSVKQISPSAKKFLISTHTHTKEITIDLNYESLASKKNLSQI